MDTLDVVPLSGISVEVRHSPNAGWANSIILSIVLGVARTYLKQKPPVECPGFIWVT